MLISGATLLGLGTLSTAMRVARGRPGQPRRPA